MTPRSNPEPKLLLLETHHDDSWFGVRNMRSLEGAVRIVLIERSIFTRSRLDSMLARSYLLSSCVCPSYVRLSVTSRSSTKMAKPRTSIYFQLAETETRRTSENHVLARKANG